MFAQAWDAGHGVVLWLISGATTDADYARYITAIRQMDERGRNYTKPAAVLVADPDAPVPNATWRKRIAEVTTEVRSDAVFALVSESPLVRGVLTALNWIHPPRYQARAFANVEDAAAWFTEVRGFSHGDVLTKLLAEARADLRPTPSSR